MITFYSEIFFELTALLIDAEIEARRLAVQTLATLERDESELLLRMKILNDDLDPEIIIDALAALLKIAPDRSFDFVAGYLEYDNRVIAEGAALALGASRHPRAFEQLRLCWDNHIEARFRQLLLVPLALVRREESFQFLLQVVEEAHQVLAGPALKALLDVVSTDERDKRRINEAVRRRGDPDLMNSLRSTSDPPPF